MNSHVDIGVYGMLVYDHAILSISLDVLGACLRGVLAIVLYAYRQRIDVLGFVPVSFCTSY